MPRVICELENASELINNIRFTADRGQMVSDEVDEATAAAFCSIPGYRLLEIAPPPPPPPETPEQTARGGKKAQDKQATSEAPAS